MADDEEKTFDGDYPFEFFNVSIIEYHYIGDTKAPLIRVIDHNND